MKLERIESDVLCQDTQSSARGQDKLALQLEHLLPRSSVSPSILKAPPPPILPISSLPVQSAQAVSLVANKQYLLIDEETQGAD